MFVAPFLSTQLYMGTAIKLGVKYDEKKNWLPYLKMPWRNIAPLIVIILIIYTLTDELKPVGQTLL